MASSFTPELKKLLLEANCYFERHGKGELNDLRYPQEDAICATRLFWTQTRLHPPEDDVCEV